MDLKYQYKIKTLFGCGGDRDKSKRSIMASIAKGDEPSSQADHLSLLARKSAEKYSLLFLDLADRIFEEF